MGHKFNPANEFYEWGTHIDGYFIRNFHGFIYIDDIEVSDPKLEHIFTAILKEKYREIGGVI